MTELSLPRHWLFLRGLSRESGHWQPFVDDCAARLGWQCHTLDLPGFGSEHQRRSPLTIAEIRCDLQQRFALPDDEPFGIVALSLGGMVALDWLYTEPQRIRHLILINSSSGDCPVWQRLQPRALPQVFRGLVSRNISTQEQAILKMVSNRHGNNAALLSRYVELRNQHPIQRRNVLRQLWAASRFRAPQALPADRLLFLASRADHMVSWQCSQQLADRYQAPVALHQSAGHDLPLDDPDWLIQRFEDIAGKE